MTKPVSVPYASWRIKSHTLSMLVAHAVGQWVTVMAMLG
jgi:hypothetical protein